MLTWIRISTWMSQEVSKRLVSASYNSQKGIRLLHCLDHSLVSPATAIGLASRVLVEVNVCNCQWAHGNLLDTVDGWNPANQLRLVVYPISCKGFSTIQTVVGLGISAINSRWMWNFVVKDLGLSNMVGVIRRLCWGQRSPLKRTKLWGEITHTL